ncbi:MAG: hypothetical protein ACKPKO_00860, partial [Candidatus Fonsibacter sp.]
MIAWVGTSLYLILLRTSGGITLGDDQSQSYFLQNGISTVIWLLTPIQPRCVGRAASEDEQAMNRMWVLLELRYPRTLHGMTMLRWYEITNCLN